MVMDECALGINDRAFNRVQLLSDIDARLTRVNHRYNRTKMTVGAFQARNNAGMGGVYMFLCHTRTLSPLGGYRKTADYCQ